MQTKIPKYVDIAEKREGDNPFRETEIGLIPRDWKVVRLGDVSETKSGGTPSRKKPKYFTGVIPWVKSGELDDNVIYDTGEKITKEALSDSSAKVFPKGTLLIAMYGATVGKTAILGIDASTNQAVCAIFPKKKSFLSEFMRYYLTFVRPKLLRERFGGAQPNISQTIIRNSKIVLPPLPEQQRIANVLGTIQRAIEQQDKIIEAAKNLKKSLMQKLFTEGLAHTEFEETEIGFIPKSWNVVRLGDVSNFKNGVNFTKDQKGNTGTLTVDVLNMYGEGLYVNLRNLYRVSKEITDDYFLRNGDILFVRSSLKREGVGWASLYKETDEKVTFCGFIIRARLKSGDISPEFLTNFLRTGIAREKLIASSGKVAITNINQGMLGQLSIPIPTLSEQQEIVHTLSTVDQKIEVEIRKRATLNELFKTMLHKLMTGQIRLKNIEV